MKIRAIATLTLALSLAAGCASQYKLPEGNQPAAVVKVKTAFDAKKANGLVPLLTTAPSLRMSVSLAEGTKNFQVMNKQLAEAADAKGVITSIEAFNIHPDRPVVLTVYTGIHWQTKTREKVQKTERVPKQVTKTVSEYDSYTKRTRYVTKTVTEYELKTKWVEEYVTKDHARGCAASVKLTPAKDHIYLLDYSNLMISDGCTLRAYRQIPRPDGTFKLEPAGEPVEAAK